MKINMTLAVPKKYILYMERELIHTWMLMTLGIQIDMNHCDLYPVSFSVKLLHVDSIILITPLLRFISDQFSLKFEYFISVFLYYCLYYASSIILKKAFIRDLIVKTEIKSGFLYYKCNFPSEKCLSQSKHWSNNFWIGYSNHIHLSLFLCFFFIPVGACFSTSFYWFCMETNL